MRNFSGNLIPILISLFAFAFDVYADRPVANAGAEKFATHFVQVGYIHPDTLVNLDGSASYDPNGDDLIYNWTLMTVPQGSQTVLQDPNSEYPYFIADQPGIFRIQLVVNDGSQDSLPDILTVEARTPDIQSVNWGNPSIFNGFCLDCITPSIDMNDDGTVVEVHHKGVVSLYYRVGIRTEGGAIDWGESHKYSEGHSPSVAINNNNMVVEVHNSSNLLHLSNLDARVGTVDRANKTIDFGPGEYYTKGHEPSVAINDANVVIEVHESASTWRNLDQKLGIVDPHTKSINFQPARNYTEGFNPSIAINNANVVVEVHESASVVGHLDYKTGIVNTTDNRVDFDASRNYSEGFFPSISMNDDGLLVTVHQGMAATDLYYKLGMSDGVTTQWLSSNSYAIGGTTPAVSMNNLNQFIEINFTPAISDDTSDWSSLNYHTTAAFLPARNSENWMTLTPSLQCRKLRNAYLPGTHDSAAYDFQNGMFSPSSVELLRDIIIALGYGDKGDLPPHDLLYWMLTEVGSFIAETIEGIFQDMAQAQNVDVIDQLKGGIRFLDLRIWMPDPLIDPDLAVGNPANYGEFFIHHSAVGHTFRKILREIADYMASVADQQELLVVQGWINSQELSNEDHRRLSDLIVTELGPYLYQNLGFSGSGLEIMDLLETPIRDMVEDGSKIIFVYKDNGEGYFKNDRDDLAGMQDPNRFYLWPPFDFEQWANSNYLDKLQSNQSNALSCYFSRCEEKECPDGREWCCKCGIWTCNSDEYDCNCDDFEPFYLSRVFRLQYILTPQWQDFVNAGLSLLSNFSPSLHSLSQTANLDLGRFLKAEKRFPGNFLTVDFFQESDVVTQSITRNYIDDIASAGMATIQPAPNAAGWNRTGVVVQISITEECPPVSTTNYIHYEISGAESDSNIVSGNLVEIPISTEGITTITFLTTDDNGNISAEQVIEVKIDKTPPEITVDATPSILWPPDKSLVAVQISGNAIDRLSGTEIVMFNVSDEYGVFEPPLLDFGESIQLEASRTGQDLDGRHYPITVTATDVAGNVGSQTINVVCPHDAR